MPWPAEQGAEALLLNTSVTQVKHIVANKNIEALEKFAVRGQLDVLSLSAVQELSADSLEMHLTANTSPSSESMQKPRV